MFILPRALLGPSTEPPALPRFPRPPAAGTTRFTLSEIHVRQSGPIDNSGWGIEGMNGWDYAAAAQGRAVSLSYLYR